MNNLQSTSKTFRDYSIDTLWFSKGEETDLKSLTIPFLHHELIINLGDTFKVGDSNVVDNLIFSPIQTETIKTEVHGRYEALGILFNPIGIYQNYGISVKEFKTLTSTDSMLFGKTEEFHQRINSTHCPSRKLDQFTAFFKMNSANKTCPSIVTDFLRFIRQSNPQRIKKAAEDLGFSSKHLIATFKDVIGITPNKFLQLILINNAIKSIVEKPEMNLTEIAIDNGFYDQSHFIRVFKNFSGMTPSCFKKTHQSPDFPQTILE